MTETETDPRVEKQSRYITELRKQLRSHQRLHLRHLRDVNHGDRIRRLECGLERMTDDRDSRRVTNVILIIAWMATMVISVLR